MKTIDERERYHIGNSSYTTIIALGAVYVAAGVYTATTNTNMPIIVEMLAAAGVLTYFSTLIKNNGFSFGHKWLKEDDRTMSQSTAARSIPWTVLVGSQLLALMTLVDTVRFNDYKQLIGLVLTLGIGYLIAVALKQGNKLIIALLKLVSFFTAINIIGVLLLFSAIMFAPVFQDVNEWGQSWLSVAEVSYSWGILSSILIWMWPLIGIWKHGRELAK